MDRDHAKRAAYDAAARKLYASWPKRSLDVEYDDAPFEIRMVVDELAKLVVDAYVNTLTKAGVRV